MIPSSKETFLSLKHLILCQCQLSLSAIEMILNAIKSHSTLQTLRLANNIKDYQINPTFPKEKKRKSRESNGQDSDMDDESDHEYENEKNIALSMTVLNTLLTSNHSQLQLIDLSYNKFPVTMLFQLISALNNLQPRLHTMDLSGMDLGVSCTELLAKNLKSYFVDSGATSSSSLNSPAQIKHPQKSLKTLLLSDNKIRPKGLLLLMKTILTYTKIKEIDLSENLFTDSISDEFSELFKTCQGNKLQVLGLAGYKNQEEEEKENKSVMSSSLDEEKEPLSEYDEDENVSELESSSSTETDQDSDKSERNNTNKHTKNKKSTKGRHHKHPTNDVNYSEFSFGNVGCQKIIKNLQYFGHQLTSIDLSYQQIENNTLVMIPNLLSYLPCLLHMDLQHNYITDHGLISFIDILNKMEDTIKEKKETAMTTNNIEKTQNIINDVETIINLEYNYINFNNCREIVKLFNNNSKINYIIYVKNQNN